jgi:hypothetical protein
VCRVYGISAVLKNMLDAIRVGPADGALMALALDVIGHEEALAKSFRKFHARNHFRVPLPCLIVAMFEPENF